MLDVTEHNKLYAEEDRPETFVALKNEDLFRVLH